MKLIHYDQGLTVHFIITWNKLYLQPFKIWNKSYQEKKTFLCQPSFPKFSSWREEIEPKLISLCISQVKIL